MLETLLGRPDVPFEPRSVGRPLPRVDGRLKVMGAARFTAEHRPDGLVHGVVIGSAIARGRVTSVDTAEAEALPGVVTIITPATAPKLKPLPNKVQGIQYSGEGGLIEMLLPMQDDRIHYAGQAIVLVVAESFEQATHAATKVRIACEEEAPEIDLDTATRRSKPDSYCGWSRYSCPPAIPPRRSTPPRCGSNASTRRRSTPTARSRRSRPSPRGRSATARIS